MAKQRATTEAAAREAQQALRALADAVHSGAKDSDFPKKLRKALRDVEPLIERADRKLGKRQAKLVEAARKERDKRAADQTKAARKARERSAAKAGARERSAAKAGARERSAAKAGATDRLRPKAMAAPEANGAGKASAPAPGRQGPGTTPRTSIAGSRARKRDRR